MASWVPIRVPFPGTWPTWQSLVLVLHSARDDRILLRRPGEGARGQGRDDNLTLDRRVAAGRTMSRVLILSVRESGKGNKNWSQIATQTTAMSWHLTCQNPRSMRCPVANC